MTTTKHLMEQKDRFNQRLTLDLQMANGEKALPLTYLNRLLKTQSLEAWNGKQDEFRDWIADQMAIYFKNLEVRIYGYGN